MAESTDECIRRVCTASVSENAAIELDQAGNVAAAIGKYQECEIELAAAIAAAIPLHQEDHPKLVQHREEILSRISYLKGLSGGPPTIPVEDQIKAVQLGMQATSAARTAAASAGGVKTMAACAAVGAAGGAVILGGALGLFTIGAVGGAAGAAYCTTRSDGVGSVARKVGDVALQGVAKTKQINDEHQITRKASDAASAAAGKAKEVNDKYGLTRKLTQGASTVVAKGQQFEEKHDVTNRVASGLSKGLTRFSQVLGSGKTETSSTARPSAGGSGS
eukprot:TRINITY_DN62428_c0_g1_i1.p1 TRINITY_DN62428_c0_g1~~TRINITY_DN62428_c0_g1_i1.p1  ORF type:complete len:277 (+),score=54.34 TRINITY_DN62428_c0_g1_i1:53-883(+)